MRPTAEELARRFSMELRLMLDSLDMWQVVVSNAAEPKDSGVCHSHDFCDANEAMLLAMEHYGIQFDPADQEQADFTSAAWTTAKKANFYI
jgi:hypothetical protein